MHLRMDKRERLLLILIIRGVTLIRAIFMTSLVSEDLCFECNGYKPRLKRKATASKQIHRDEYLPLYG